MEERENRIPETEAPETNELEIKAPGAAEPESPVVPAGGPEDEEKKRREQTRGFLYIAAGGYLMYIAYKIMRDIREGVSAAGSNRALFIAFAVVFAVAGLGIILMGARKLKK